MNAPKSGLNPTTNSVGFTAKLVTVQSISPDGQTAFTVDRQRTQTQVPMLVQRSKGPLPQPGEAWLLTQDLGMWTFGAYVGKSASDFGASGTASGQAVTVSAQAPAGPSAGDIWVDSADANAFFRWTGTAWAAVQLGTAALAPASVTAPLIAPGAITAAKIAAAAGITAGQVGFTASQIGGVQVFQDTSEPTGANPGDLWLVSDEDNAIRRWNGNTWELLLLGPGAIAPSSLTAAQLAADAGILPSQVSFSYRDIGGLTASILSEEPSSPAVGDLWYDATNGYALKQWNGTAWLPYQFGTEAIAAGSVTAELIAAGTITAVQIAAGTIIAGIVNGTTIMAATFIGSDWISNPSGTFYYSGTPAANNLSSSIVPGKTAVKDPFGNWALAGETTYAAVFQVSPHVLVGYQATQWLEGGMVVYYDPTTSMGGASSPWGATSLVLILSADAGPSTNVILQADGIEITALSFGISLGGPVSATGGTPASPTVITTDSPNNLSLLHGWSGGPLRYWLTAHDSVRIIGPVNPAAMTSGIIGTLTGIYVPTVGGDFAVAAHTATPPTQGMFTRVDTSGNLIAINATTSSGVFGVDIDCPLH